MSQEEQELEVKFQQTLVGMHDGEASTADIKALLSEANRPAMLSFWRRCQRQSDILAGRAWVSDAASVDFLEQLHRRLPEVQPEVLPEALPEVDAKTAGINASGQAIGSWLVAQFDSIRPWAVAASVAAVAAVAMTWTINYSPTRNIEPDFASTDDATDVIDSEYARQSADFVRQRVSAYTLNHANNRVVSTHFVPFTKMSTYKTSWSGQGSYSEEERNAPIERRTY